MRRVTGLISCLFAAAAILAGQSAELSGIVYDPREEGITDARLELRNVATGLRLRAKTNNEGFYWFSSLKPGVYDATVQASGFRTMTRGGIEVNVNDRAGLDFAMQIGEMASTITVSAGEAPRPDSLGAAIGTTVDNKFVENMPLNGRSFQSLIHVTPGVVVMPSYQDALGQFSVNGQRTNTNYFTVDGVSANFGSTASVALGQSVSGSVPGLNILGGTNSLVSVDAMQEFRIQTSSFAPEHGRGPGAQIAIVTKSGTNQMHGTAFDYLRNDIFDARNWFNMVPQTKPPLRQNNFGGTLGGPLVRNRTFYFFSYEGLRLRQPNTQNGNFLTAEARSRAALVYQPFVNAYPLPDGPVNPDGITAPLTLSQSDPSQSDATSGRIDHSLSSRVTFFGRYNHAPSMQGFRSFALLQSTKANIDTATAGVTFIVSESRVNDLRANWSRATGEARTSIENIGNAIVPPDSALFPSFSGPGSGQAVFGLTFASTAIQSGTRANNLQRQFNLLDCFSMTTGLHQLKFGADFRRMRPANSALVYGYGATLTSYQQLLSGTMNRLSILTTEPLSAGLNNFSLFAQDTWKAARRFTLTYGLRWEINTSPESTISGKPVYAVAGVFDSRPLALVDEPLWSTRYGNVAPRIGAAWMAGAKTSLRAGLGFYHDLSYGAAVPFSTAFPYYRTSTSAYTPAAPFDLNGTTFQPLPFSTTIPPNSVVSAVDPALKTPVTVHWNVAWERAFGPSQIVTVTYAGAKGKSLVRRDLVIFPGSAAVPNGAAAAVTRNADSSSYRSLQLQALRRMSRGVQAMVSYALSNSTDTGSTDAGLGSQASYAQSLAASVGALQLPASAPSDFDVRHTFGAAVSWELPRPRKDGWNLFRDWALDGVVRANSGRPINVRYQRLYSAGAYNVQPDMVAGQPFWIQNANEPHGRVLNPQAFAIPPGQSGNFPRNSIRGFGFTQFDVALRRRFTLTEQLKLDLRVEYFNVANHPMFANPSNLWGVGGFGPWPSFGTIIPGSTLNVGLGGGGIFGGQAAIYAPGGPRSAQFSLKLRF